ncbi:uncharacterized protein LOC134224815 [Armigeres subalbatus]|uniref:uncharacterized protein LOC134224815 n=1 Tax=Armigeres subalbatus TaxID=124917 RepID=UPI002ED5064D
MQVLAWFSWILIFEYFGALKTEESYEASDEFEEQLNYFGNVEILHSLLQDYASTEKHWSSAEYETFDREVVNSLNNVVAEAYETESQNDPVKGSSYTKVLTNFCGPGNWSINGEVTQNPYFHKIDLCCKEHDECPDYIVNRGDYERYPGLPYKAQIFTRERCSCDAQFFACLRDVATFFSYAVAWIYSKAQTYCFEHEYPVLECRQFMNDGFLSAPRCVEYLVDNSNTQGWQWFNIPYLSANLTCFPKVIYTAKNPHIFIGKNPLT